MKGWLHKRTYSSGEVAVLLNTSTRRLRYWEQRFQEFTAFHPIIRNRRERFYKKEQVTLLSSVAQLLQKYRMTPDMILQILRYDGVHSDATLCQVRAVLEGCLSDEASASKKEKATPLFSATYHLSENTRYKPFSMKPVEGAFVLAAGEKCEEGSSI